MIKKIVVSFLAIIALACSNKEGNKKESRVVLPESSGRINHVVVVVEPDIWKGQAGVALREVLETPIGGLPQEEYQFKTSTIPARVFDKMFQHSRNLLVLQLSDQKTFRLSSNVYAKPQTILEVKAPTEEELVSLIKEKGSQIIKSIRDRDLTSMQKLHNKKRFKNKLGAMKGLGINMIIPNKYTVVMDTLDSFMWLRSRIAGGIAVGDQTNELIAYEAPLFSNQESIPSQIIKNRDSIGKRFIWGDDIGEKYMITEAARTPVVKKIKLKGFTAYETRGTWELFGDFMAGPFLNYSIVDEKNNRVLVIEGFNYAPSVSKRDFIFELEAILKSVSVN